jgi:hypothetical protein
VTADEVGASLEQMTQKLDAKAVDQFGDVLQRLNVRWLTQLPLSDRLSLISQALSRINDPTQRARIAIELFGERVGRAFLLATAQSQQLQERLQSLGEITAEDAMQATQFSAAWRVIRSELASVWGYAASALSPLLVSLAHIVRDNIRGIVDWISANRGLFAVVASIGVAVATLGTAMLAFAVALKAASVVVGGLMTVMVALKAAVLALVAPVGAVVTAAVMWGVRWREVSISVRESVQSIGAQWSETISLISSLITRGDIQSAWELLTTQMQATWTQMVIVLRRTWNQFIEDLVGFLRDNPWVGTLIGAAVGSRFGVYGLVGGAAVGTGANLLVGAFSREIVGGLRLSTEAQEARLQAELVRLRNMQQQLRQRISEPMAISDEQQRQSVYLSGVQRTITPGYVMGEARGTFDVSAAYMRFAYGQRVERKQEDLLADILREVRRMQQDVRDGMRVR